MTRKSIQQPQHQQQHHDSSSAEGGRSSHHRHRRTTTMIIRTLSGQQSNCCCSRWLLLATVMICQLSLSSNNVQAIPNLSSRTKEAEHKSGHKSIKNLMDNSNADAFEPLAMQVFEEVLQAPIPFSNEEEETLSKKLVQELTENEKSIAARTSYAYWYFEGGGNQEQGRRRRRQQHGSSCSNTSIDNGNGNDDDTEMDDPDSRMKMAMREARRHLRAEKNDFDSALHRLKETCHYRMEEHVDQIKSCFNSQNNNNDASSLSEIEMEFQQKIDRDFHRQAVVMRGIPSSKPSLPTTTTTSATDKSKQTQPQTHHQHPQQPVLVKFPRFEGGTTEQEYILSQLYIAERAVACTEFATRGQQEKVIVIMDGAHNHSSQHTPPIAWQLSAIRRLQQLYPERLGRLIVLDAPFWMRSIYHGIRPFLSQTTKDKIQMVSSSSSTEMDEQLQTILNHWRHPVGSDGEEDLSSPVDIKRYLYETPFFCPYGNEC